MKIMLVSAVTMIAMFVPIAVCNTPVFRYALERWRSDSSRLILFHDGALDSSVQETVNQLEETSRGLHSNLEIVRVDLGKTKEQGVQDIWAELKNREGVALPYASIQSPLAAGKKVQPWHGPVTSKSFSTLGDSPVRRELVQRILKGDSVVWLLIRSSQQDRNATLRMLLDKELKRWEKELELPEGIGLPGSELYSEIPLFLRFSILEVDPKDPREEYLARLFHGFQPEAMDADEPLLVPVFGRGRALEVIPAGRMEAGLIEDLTKFLCGACSCQVKEKNPGFDLLLSVDWNRELFGEGFIPDPAEGQAQRSEASPKLLTIPPGKVK